MMIRQLCGINHYKLIRRFGIEKAGQYLKANEEALAKYRRLCSRIDCDFEEKISYVYSLDDRQTIENEIIALEKLGANAAFVNAL